MQFVIGGGSYEQLAQWRDIVIREAEKVPGISNLRSDYRERKPKIDVAIDRDRAADLGVSLANVGRTLETILGSRVVTTFIERGEEYRVILQGADEKRQTPSDLETIYVRSERSGELIPLSNLVRLKEAAGPVDLRRFDRMRSISISGTINPGYSLGAALADVRAQDRVLRALDQLEQVALAEVVLVIPDRRSRRGRRRRRSAGAGCAGRW